MSPQLTCGLRFLCIDLENVPVSLSPPPSLPPSLPPSALSLGLKWSAQAVLGTWLAALLGGPSNPVVPGWTPKNAGIVCDAQAGEGVDEKRCYFKQY